MDIKQLKYFLALARQNHMSLTANLLGITQPALSKSIHNLEKELGVELFDRQGNHIYLNQNGEEFARCAMKILNDLDAGTKLLQTSRFNFRGKIRISCHAFTDSIMDCVSEYMVLNPLIQVELYQSHRGDDRLNEKVDFMLSAVTMGTMNQDWVSQPLFQEEAYILISSRYREYPPTVTELSVAELKDDIFIGDFLVTEVFAFTDLIHRVCQAGGFQPKIRYFTDDFLSKVRLVEEGIGITILPHACLRIAQKLAPSVRIFRIYDYPTQRTLSLLRKKDSQLSEEALDFWNFVTDYYSNERNA